LALAGFPESYADPLYSQLARAAEQKLGLPAGILDAIRMRGERSNADQISPAGARTPYQFIPSTRQGFINKFGIDPWSNADAATNAAGLHILDDYKRTGSWNEAIARYNGGQHPGRVARAYAKKVGDFDAIDTSKPYYAGADDMALNPSLYPVVNGVDPLAPEPMQQAAPVLADAGPSVSVPAASPAVAKKRGGILGALSNIFMPDPGSLWAGALRDGLTNARESQQLYQEQQAQKAVDLATANVKLKRMIQQGEFQIVGNNVFHTKPDGTYEMIEPPQTASEYERLINQWKSLPDGDPAKSLIERLLLGSQSDEAQANARTVAQMRANATTGAAKIRANAAQTTKTQNPPTGFILDQ